MSDAVTLVYYLLSILFKSTITLGHYGIKPCFTKAVTN